MKDWIKTHQRLILTIVITLASVVAGIQISQDENGNTVIKVPHRSVVTTESGTATITTKVEGDYLEGMADHSDARDETPSGVAPQVIEAGRQQQETLAHDDQLPLVTPDAAPSQRGCTSNFVQNFSSRRGVKPRIWVIHYTVSSNRVGVDDVNAIVNLFNTPAFQASSHYVIDREGNCRYIVRESDKAWTEAGFNSLGISVEIINSGKEANLIDGPGLKKLGRVISDSAKRWEIPLQVGAVSGCTVTKPGLVTHQMLGACGGGHVDIAPYPLSTVLGAALLARANECGAKCHRARDLRARHKKVHAQISRCKKVGGDCTALRRKNTILHRVAKREGVTL